MELSSFINKVKSSKELDFGNIFSNSIELFKKAWSQGLLHMLFSLIFIIPLFLVIYIPMISYAISQEQGQYGQEPPPEVIITTAILVLIAVFVITIFTLALQAGFYKVLKMIDEGKNPTAKDHFIFFKGKYLKKTFVLSLMNIGIALISVLLCYVPLLYAMVPLSLIAPIFAFNPGMSPSEVIKACFTLGNKKWLIAFGLLFISSMLTQIVGLLLCGIGIFFTASFVYLPMYELYKSAIGFEEDDEISQIGINQE